MSRARDFVKRNEDGNRFEFHGVDLVHPADALPPGKYPFAQNIRNYIRGRVTSRATQDVPQLQYAQPAHSIRRLNDSTPLGPPNGYVLIVGAGTTLNAGPLQVATSLSGNPVCMVPFEPSQSVQPWMYVADANAMLKVRSDGTCYAMGIAEPQVSPVVGTASTTTSGTAVLPCTTIPWATASGQNAAFAYGDTTGAGTAPVVIPTPVPNSTVNLTITGNGVVNGLAVVPSSLTPTTPTYPNHFLNEAVPPSQAPVVIGAFTDALGNVLAKVTPTDITVAIVGQGAVLTVPTNAVQLQLGISCPVGAFNANTGSFNVSFAVTVSAIATKVSLIGNVTVHYWGDSPHSGPVADYIWKNPQDGAGWGPARGTASAAGSTTGNSLDFDIGGSSGAQPVQWIVFQNGISSGTKNLFSPALESEGYQDFNAIILGQLFVPAAGAYTFTITYKDNILWGIGGNATWPGIHTIVGGAAQTKTVVNGSPLLPAPLISGSGGVVGTQSVAVTFPGAGLYPIEIDWDYWFHSGRTLGVTCNSAQITPLDSNYKQQVQYRYVYRSSATGAVSNPSPESIPEDLPVIANTVTAVPSPDPQVDKIDFYRMDTDLLNWTYVLTTDNTTPPTTVTDALLDTDVANNPILQFDNYQPFPVVDLPHSGTVNVVGNLVEWNSGDTFNVRWLPGTLINIGGFAYTLDRRPSSSTVLTAGDVAAGNNLVYEIAQPLLAAQPMKSMWGPTSEGSFIFACGDDLNPGTIYWTKGNNPDSAPDTNNISLTSPSEPLINGCIVNGISLAMSSERGWIFYPTFTSALATVTGEAGSTWNPVLCGLTRGLYIRKCIAVSGGRLVFFRVKDGISVSDSGGPEVSITDEDLYNLFPHEGYVPGPIVIQGGGVAWPPDDTNPEAQQFSVANGYLYYDYLDVNGVQRNLVYDIVAKGWVFDAYDWAVVTHALEEGPNINGTLTGCFDGSVRALVAQGQESQQLCVLCTPCEDGGEIRAQKQIGDVFLKALVQSAFPLNLAAFTSRYANPVIIQPNQINGTSSYQPYIIDFPLGLQDAYDFELALTWQIGASTILEAWQPDWIPLPDTIQDRTFDWDDGGYAGPKFIQGVRIEANTFGQDKLVQIQNSDDGAIYSFNEAPFNFNGHSAQEFSVPPFVSHAVRLISGDGIQWRVWKVEYIFKPFPNYTEQWRTELSSLGLMGWGTIREINVPYISNSDLTLNLYFDNGPTLSYGIPNSNGLQRKFKQTIAANKFKLVQFEIISTSPFRIFQPDVEVKTGQWGRTSEFKVLKPFGAPAMTGAEV